MDVIIIGGGIAGLSCARSLSAAGKSFVIVEASDRVGGRIATDEIDGFKLDRGFQVFLTAYPECRQVLDYDALRLKTFEPGALVVRDGKLHRFSDPWRRPQHLLATAISPVGTIGDKLRIARLRSYVRSGSLDQLFQRPEIRTMEALERAGFSKTIIERFFRPFLGGIFLEKELATSTRMFEFVFRMFSEGEAAIPEAGMQAIPRQVAASLPSESLRLNTKVVQIENQNVVLDTGETLTAPAIVLAVANPEAELLVHSERKPACGVTCIYFAAERSPINEATLVLNGEGRGPINNLCVPSDLCPDFAPAGKALISVSVLGAGHDEQLLDDVRAQLAEWFGPDAHQYRHLKTYDIPYALPSQTTLDPVKKPVVLRPGLVRCGDEFDTASINGAMVAGRRAAEAILGGNA